jgi:uncharacterized protein YlaN (UPF0358 family)
MNILTLDDLTNELVSLRTQLVSLEREINNTVKALEILNKQKNENLAKLEKVMEDLEIYKKYSNRGCDD